MSRLCGYVTESIEELDIRQIDVIAHHSWFYRSNEKFRWKKFVTRIFEWHTLQRVVAFILRKENKNNCRPKLWKLYATIKSTYRFYRVWLVYSGYSFVCWYRRILWIIFPWNYLQKRSGSQEPMICALYYIIQRDDNKIKRVSPTPIMFVLYISFNPLHSKDFY